MQFTNLEINLIISILELVVFLLTNTRNYILNLFEKHLLTS